MTSITSGPPRETGTGNDTGTLNAWHAVSASVTGPDHEAFGEGCQDRCVVVRPLPGWLIAIVSDGAGSASRAEEGAEAIVHGMSEDLSRFVGKDGTEQVADVGHWTDVIAAAVERVRQRLIDTVPGAPASASDNILWAYHATVVGVIAGPETGMFFHIGDGFAVAWCSDDPATRSVSPPENGEYANETYFYTLPWWRDHLRVTPIEPRCDTIVLMTDGVQPFAMKPDASGLTAAFIDPVHRFLRTVDENTGATALAHLLDRQDARRISGDDKTFVWAHRTEREVGGHE